jgi:hypothetical protein
MSMQQGRRVMSRAGRERRLVQWLKERPPIFTLSRHELNDYSAPTFQGSVGKDWVA